MAFQCPPIGAPFGDLTMFANYILVTLFFVQIIVSDGGWVRKLHPDGKCGDLELPDWIIPMALSAGNCSRGTCAELGYNIFLGKTIKREEGIK